MGETFVMRRVSRNDNKNTCKNTFKCKKMHGIKETMSVTTLPVEVWVHVFGFLSYGDKLSVRSCCKTFQNLIDQRSVWKNTAVFLHRSALCNTKFLKALGKRRMRSVVLQNGDVKCLQQVGTWLPWISSLTLNLCSKDQALETLGTLVHLRRLVIRQCLCPILTSSLPSLMQLTDLCLCEVKVASMSEISSAISQLVNLTTLYYHEENHPLPKTVFHNLSNLKHLSLRMGPRYGTLPDDYFCPTTVSGSLGGLHCGLTSLEILNYTEPCLSSDAICRLSLTKLTVHYKSWAKFEAQWNLANWLEGLPLLSELKVSLGYPLSLFAKSIPRTVHSLSLMGVKASLKSVRTAGKQVPDLLHLSLDLFCNEINHIITEMPKVFPKLQTLKMRHNDVPVSTFLSLQNLSELRQVVILDAPPSPSPTVLDLAQKLNVESNNRICVFNSTGRKDQTFCSCGV